MTKVTIYTRDGCMQCFATKKLFEKHNFEVEMIDITNNKTLESEIIDEGYRSLPVVIVHNTAKLKWSGFRPNLIEELARFENCG